MTDRTAHQQRPPRPVEAAVSAPPAGALPQLLSTFVGRIRELEEVGDLLARDDVRLVTLTGPGGVGKSRLALRIAETVVGSGTQAWFISLTTISDPALVPAAIARALGFLLSEGEDADAELIDAARDLRGLLFIDGFEQVLRAAPLITALLSANDGLTALVTSRAMLRVSGEHIYEVPPLGLPKVFPAGPARDIATSDAVNLFITRATETGRDLPLTPESAMTIAAICRALDGMPLAIELAVQWTRILTPDVLLERLEPTLKMLEGGPRNAPERQRTMRQAIASSHVLLAPEEQVLLRRLAVFVGGFTLPAMVSVTETSTTGDALRHLSALIDHSLVRKRPDGFAGMPPGISRYMLLNAIREFGLEMLREAGELDEVRRRHAAWCLDLAETAVRERMGLATSRAVDLLVAELHNLRAAINWLEQAGDVPTALRLAAALWPLWLEHGEMTEGRRQLSRLLALPGATADPAARAGAMQVLGMLCQAQGDLGRAEDLSLRALAELDALHDDRGAGAALTTLGLVSMLRGDHDAANELLERSLERFQAAGDIRAGSWALRHLSSVAYRQGDIDRYEALARQGLEIIGSAGSAQDLARLNTSLALADAARGRLEDASDRLRHVTALYREAGDRWGEADALQRLGTITCLRGDTERADELLASSASLLASIGDPEGMVRVLCGQGWVARARRDPDRAAERFAEATALAEIHGEKRALADSLLGSGVVALERGDHLAAAAAWRDALALVTALGDRIFIARLLVWISHLAEASTSAHAARIVGAATAMLDAAGVPLEISDVADHAEAVASIRRAPGSAAYDAATATGASLPTEVIDDAIAILDRAATHTAAVRRQRPSRDASSVLSAREREVIILIASGHTDQTIARQLSISRRTVATHVGHIFNKLGISSRSAAAAWAARNGLV